MNEYSEESKAEQVYLRHCVFSDVDFDDCLDVSGTVECYCTTWIRLKFDVCVYDNLNTTLYRVASSDEVYRMKLVVADMQVLRYSHRRPTITGQFVSLFFIPALLFATCA